MVWLLSTILLATVTGFAADEVDEAVRSVLEDSRYQRELPGSEVDPVGDVEPATPSRRPPERRAVGSAVADVSSALMWVLVVVIVGIVGIWLFGQFQSYERAGPAGSDAVAGDGESLSTGDRTVADAEALARQGRFDEAVHALLLHALASLRRERAGHLPDSLTSREVLREVPLGTVPHGALRSLIEVVELSLFGGRPVDREDYSRCSGHYREFISSLRTRVGLVAGTTA